MRHIAHVMHARHSSQVPCSHFPFFIDAIIYDFNALASSCCPCAVNMPTSRRYEHYIDNSNFNLFIGVYARFGDTHVNVTAKPDVRASIAEIGR